VLHWKSSSGVCGVVGVSGVVGASVVVVVAGATVVSLSGRGRLPQRTKAGTAHVFVTVLKSRLPEQVCRVAIFLEHT